jgi:hypothetical protein
VAILAVTGKQYDDYQAFTKDMQLFMPSLGVQLNNRLYRVIGSVFGVKLLRPLAPLDQESAAEIKKKGIFTDWEDFAEFLYERKLIAARTTGFVPHRPRNLGVRPPWIKPINDQRPVNQGQAIRHIVPSHLLGYAVENAAGSIRAELGTLIDAYTGAFAAWKKVDPITVEIIPHFASTKPALKRTTDREWTARRWAWALLYNHPGNLWVGRADDNTTIGFMYATVYGILSRMRKMLDPVSATPDVLLSPKKGVKIAAPKESESLAKVLDKALGTLKNIEDGDVMGEGGLNEDINRVLRAADKVDDVDVLSATDIICFVEDVGANLELDIPRLSDWSLVQDWREKFMQPGISAAELRRFLAVRFTDSLSPP